MSDAYDSLYELACQDAPVAGSEVREAMAAWKAEILREASLELHALDLPQQVLDMGPVAASCARAAILAAAALISPDSKED